MILFAHRGARADAPENTVEAFELAVELGATGLESDAWATSDGVAVLDHDGLVGAVPIAELRHDELPAHIPALADLYAACGTDLPLSLDIKDPAAFAPVLGAARAAGAAERLWCCDHRWRRLAQWRSSAPEVRLVDSTYVGFMSGGPSQRFAALAGAGIDAVNLHHSEWTAEVRQLAADHGLAAFGWDAQAPEVIERLVALGLDGIYSDHVARLVELAGDHQV